MKTIDNPTIKSKMDTVTHIDLTSNPVIFWDTCSLLDILRLPVPNREQPTSKVSKVMSLRQKILSGDIISLASVLTVKEFNHHVNHIHDEVIRSATAISKQYNKFLSFIKTVNPTISEPDVDLASFHIETDLLGIIHDIITKTIFVDRENDFCEAAEDRVINKIPPAKKKGEFKDAYIWNTCLAVRKLSQRKNSPYAFISSNIKDYTQAPNKSLDPILAAEATAVDLTYYYDIDVAHKDLNLKGLFSSMINQSS